MTQLRCWCCQQWYCNKSSGVSSYAERGLCTEETMHYTNTVSTWENVTVNGKLTQKMFYFICTDLNVGISPIYWFDGLHIDDDERKTSVKLNNKLRIKPYKEYRRQVITQVKTLALQENSVNFVDIIIAMVDICRTDSRTMVLDIMIERTSGWLSYK